MGLDIRSMVEHMGGVAWGVVICLTIMSIYSIGVMIERWWTYRQAIAQSKNYAGDVLRFLKAGKIKEAIDASRGPNVKHSHLAKVFVAGLQEWQYQQELGETERDRDAALDAAKRAIQRATAVNLADLKRGLSGLATIGSTAPFVGLFGTTFGIINAFAGMALTGSGGIATIMGGISEALITTAYGLFVAVPAVWAYNYLGGKVEGFNVEMDNSSSELLEYFIRKGAEPPRVEPPPRPRRGGSHQESKLMSMQVGDSKAGPMAAINVTPMADIMIVLLIIFMVITPMLAKGVDVKLPTANNTKERQDKQKTLIVAIKNDVSHTTYLNGKKIENLAELTGLIKQGLEDLPEDEKILYIKADEALAYEDVMNVMDFVREGGVEDVALIAERQVQG